MSLFSWFFGNDDPEPEPFLRDADGDALAVEYEDEDWHGVPDNVHNEVLHTGVGHLAPIVTRRRTWWGLGKNITTDRYALTDNGRTSAADVAEALRRSKGYWRGKIVKLKPNEVRDLERRKYR
jgi:hypothetical protein